MRIIETQTNITEDHRLTVQLPDDIEAGEYEIAIIINPQSQPPKTNLNQLQGKIKAFREIDPVTWQKKIRGEWDETRLSD
ncbi:hypothetical protein [Crocosphaera chwakensis]|uniref:hypothetical protein n=1 Tax=Crocosphaera chwakensis TaxID=2546361 RepID=UPI0002D84399|nr:hypothetical protein [Crocosphaera chwakensis]